MRLPIIIMASIALASCGEAETPKETKETKETAQPVVEAPRPAIEVTAKELAKAYESNEVAAQLKYGDGPLKVTGKVTGIELDFLDNAVIQFASNNQFMPVQGTLKNKDESASLVKGQNATLQCESAAEVLGSPILRKCTLVTQ
jgi:hypothetical protein